MPNPTMIPDWQYNTLPGNANQGAILVTRNDITVPPFTQDDFIFIAMEDVIGTADVKLEYDEENNKYKIWQAKGHRDNEGHWSYEYALVGTWDALTEEAAETLRQLKYVDYIYDTSTPNTLKVYGVEKDGDRVLLTNISFATTQYVDQAINNLRTKWEYKGVVAAVSSLPSNAEQGSVYQVTGVGDLYVNLGTPGAVNWKPFTKIYETFKAYAIELQKGTNGLYAQLRFDSEEFEIGTNSDLKSKLINDSMGELDLNADKHTYSIPKLISLFTSVMKYKGQKEYYDELPTTGNHVGDCWNVVYDERVTPPEEPIATGFNYAWNGTGWDRLAGQYIAGAGISIQGNVISSTGINFRVGDGLETTGSGDTTALKARLTDGCQFVNVGTLELPVNAIGAKANTNKGINVTTNGIETKLGSGLQFSSNGNIEVINPITYASSVTYADNSQTIDSEPGVAFSDSVTHTFTQQEIDNSSNAMLVFIPRITNTTTLRYYRFEAQINGKTIYLDTLNKIANASDNISNVEKLQMLFPVSYLKAGDIVTLSLQGITVTANTGVQTRLRILGR